MRTLVIMLVLGVVVHVTTAFAHHRFTRHAFIRIGQNGYWVASVYGCVMEDAQARIQDCSFGN